MSRFFLLMLFAVIFLKINAQSVTQKIQNAMNILLKDEQMTHAITGLYIVETKSGKIVYQLNENVGLPAASTQKIVTACAAYELLGTDYKFKTYTGIKGLIEDSTLYGEIYFKGNGDPTTGSWRFEETKRDSVLKKIVNAVKYSGIKNIEGNILFDESNFSYQPLPGGWPWEDIGNYYGAGSWAFNWNENQYDLILKAGEKAGDSVTILSTDPKVPYDFKNFLKTAEKGTGDNSIIYMSPYSENGFIEGTIPLGEKEFVVSGSLTNPAKQAGRELKELLLNNHVNVSGETEIIFSNESLKKQFSDSIQILDSIVSPSLDSIMYWFLQKSINLYGEALTKTIAFEKEGFGSTETGVHLIKKFWQEHGIDSLAMNIDDGSGLTPQNRITAKALVEVLQFAKTKPWYGSFYNALPVFNNIKMKSGTIGGTKAFTGYCTSKKGIEYTFSFIINNYQKGSIVQKMYKVLDELK